MTKKIGMTETGFYASLRIESLKFDKLIKICEALEVPLQYIVSDNLTEASGTATNQVQVANQVKKNRQQISVGGENANELRHQLQLCQVEQANLEQRLKDKEELIEVLRWR
ncbi:hypothetical protein [Rufibacter roseus]|uniref:HTH cro/C1-type domain-containing protein n=1 Tax=Rufibacter roseus TaxID=1567108 RepID=A0ABW2DSU7_9BACT|nr:hypothetical protein [Rufibacter roseus]